MAVLLAEGTGLAHDQAELSRVDLVVAQQQKDSETGLSEDVQDAVEDGLGVWVDNVAALR